MRTTKDCCANVAFCTELPKSWVPDLQQDFATLNRLILLDRGNRRKNVPIRDTLIDNALSSERGILAHVEVEMPR